MDEKRAPTAQKSPVTAAGMATLTFGLLVFAAVTPVGTIQAWSGLPQTVKQSAGGNLAVVATDLREKRIRFGDRLDVLVTLQNQGNHTIKIPEGALQLENEGWAGWPGGGSGLGESPLARAADGGKGEIILQPGESVVLFGSNTEMAAKSIGPMKAEFTIQTENEVLRAEIGKPAKFSVSYYVTPSRLIAATWTAKTEGERQALQPQIRDLLLLGSKAQGWRDKNYVRGTLTFMSCYALPYLEAALKDPDPIVRRQALVSLPQSAWAAASLNSFVAQLDEKEEGRAWAASLKCDDNAALRTNAETAIAGLADADPSVRIAAISTLTERAAREVNLRRSLANSRVPRDSMDEQAKRMYDSVGLFDPAVPLIQKMAGDPDAGVRAAAQKFLSNFASQHEVAGGVAVSLADPNAAVRNEALEALRHSHEPPPMATIEQAFASTKGEIALGLIELIYEREDSELAARLSPGFRERSAAERLMILTAIAGHADEAAVSLVALGLKDSDSGVQRAALMRLLGFPAEEAIALIRASSSNLSPDVREIGIAVQREMESRAAFPFLARGSGSAAESTFPSQEGTEPMVSPDGKWVAYVETGWGHPGGSGGRGRSNLLSITHVVRADGYADRIVSDMFLVGWMSDSSRVASARDGHAAIVDLNGKTVVEFGDPLDKPERWGIRGEVWPAGNPRHQFGVMMPHTKRFQNRGDDSRGAFIFDYGEDGAFSADGKWFGPRRLKDKWEFQDSDDHKFDLKVPEGSGYWSSRAVWSPDGAHVALLPVEASGILGRGGAIEPGDAYVIDFGGQKLGAVIQVDHVPSMGEWDYRKARWNPWSRDGKHLAFVRRGQVWTADPDGGNARQVTFDASNKAFPTFSPEGSKIAYVTWQFDYREHYMRLGPTDLWVVDCTTGLATRVTHSDPGRIEGLDWLDSSTLIYDRLGEWERHSGLRTASLR
jgi:HEAT repeat protein